MDKNLKDLNLPPDGIYYLPDTVPNPRGDKRMKYGQWFELPEISKGYFVVETIRQSLTIKGEKIEYDRRKITAAKRRGDVYADTDDPKHRAAFKAISSLLEKCDKSFDTVTLDWYDDAKSEVLQELVSNGEVTLEQIEAAYQRCWERIG